MTQLFHREARYIVVKLKHLRAAQGGSFPDNKIHGLLNYLSATGVEPVKDALVIEADWPEYEQAWHMIERRVSGQTALGGEPIRRFKYIRETLLIGGGMIQTPTGDYVKFSDFAQLQAEQAEVEELKAGLRYESERNALLLERVTELEAERSKSTEAAKS